MLSHPREDTFAAVFMIIATAGERPTKLRFAPKLERELKHIAAKHCSEVAQIKLNPSTALHAGLPCRAANLNFTNHRFSGPHPSRDDSELIGGNLRCGCTCWRAGTALGKRRRARGNAQHLLPLHRYHYRPYRLP